MHAIDSTRLLVLIRVNNLSRLPRGQLILNVQRVLHVQNNTKKKQTNKQNKSNQKTKQNNPLTRLNNEDSFARKKMTMIIHMSEL